MTEIVLVTLLSMLAIWSTFKVKEADDIGVKIGDRLGKL